MVMILTRENFIAKHALVNDWITVTHVLLSDLTVTALTIISVLLTYVSTDTF